MQFELKELQRPLIASASSWSCVTNTRVTPRRDRIAVMNTGRVDQVGAPTEIYERPRTRFVADFIGEINILEEGAKPRALRPEKLRIVSTGGGARLAGVIETANFLGGATLYRVRADERILLARETHAGERSPRGPGDPVGLLWNDADTVTLEA
jgi:ABC-type Fe3+/spermidine/putrescine transport system ATPase subunit